MTRPVTVPNVIAHPSCVLIRSEYDTITALKQMTKAVPSVITVQHFSGMRQCLTLASTHCTSHTFIVECCQFPGEVSVNF